MSTNPRTEQDELRLSNWQRVWENSYGKQNPSLDPTFDISTWISSYTGTPIPRPEMEEWVMASVQPILEIYPSQKKGNRLLEIGCGTGLMLYPLLPYVEEYVGIDYSEEALKTLRQNLSSKKISQHVQLFNCSATGLSELNQGTFDTIILNSVAQYFPSLEYFEEMLNQALGLLASEGKIFLGDLRNANLNEAFQASVKLHKSADDVAIDAFYTAAKRRVLAEKELLYAPEYFSTLSSRFPKIRHARAELRRGQFHNEMTAFRYNVVLDSSSPAPSKPIQTLNWQKDELNLEKLMTLVAKNKAPALTITNIPNARIQEAVNIVKLASSEKKPATTGELRSSLVRMQKKEHAIHPQEIWSSFEAQGFRVEIHWSTKDLGCMDVMLRMDKTL